MEQISFLSTRYIVTNMSRWTRTINAKRERERDSNKEKIEKDRIVIHFLADSWKESVPFPLSLLQRLDGSDDRRARERTRGKSPRECQLYACLVDVCYELFIQ